MQAIIKPSMRNNIKISSSINGNIVMMKSLSFYVIKFIIKVLAYYHNIELITNVKCFFVPRASTRFNIPNLI
jgi:hypothetical protein